MSQRGQTFERIARLVFLYSTQKEDSCAATEERLADAARLFLGLLTTVLGRARDPFAIKHLLDGEQPVTAKSIIDTEQLEASSWLHHDIWHHRDDLVGEFMKKGYADTEEFELRATLITSFASDFLARDWIDSRYVEWLIVDSLVCNRIRQFGAAILDSDLPLKDVPFAGEAALAGSGMEAVLFGQVRAKVARWLIRLLLLLILPLATGWHGLRDGNTPLIVAGAAISAMYLTWSMYTTIRSELGKLLGRQSATPLQIKLDLWNVMHNSYRYLRGPVVDPTRVLKALDAAAEKGATWDGAIYAILNRVVGRDPSAWLTDDSHTYPEPLMSRPIETSSD